MDRIIPYEHGQVFFAEVPYQFGPPEENEIRPLPLKPTKWKTADRKRFTILIVEDQLLVAENLKDVLQKEGFKVAEVVPSAEEAILKVSRLSPDLILMDIRLAGPMDGIQAAIVIHETMKKVPVLFLTAYSEREFPDLVAIDRALYDFLEKPYNPRQLIRMIEKLLGPPPPPSR